MPEGVGDALGPGEEVGAGCVAPLDVAPALVGVADEVEDAVVTAPPCAPSAVPPLTVVPSGGGGGMVATETVAGEVEVVLALPLVAVCVCVVAEVVGRAEVVVELVVVDPSASRGPAGASSSPASSADRRMPRNLFTWAATSRTTVRLSAPTVGARALRFHGSRGMARKLPGKRATLRWKGCASV
ncbi:MAG: hypothetical protein KGJ86_11890 [Chloroflexota bacterium]|nr:hypothetical protein [Chloroflexota bacterium]